jgi:hypothetical protein
MLYLHSIVPPISHRGLTSFSVYMTYDKATDVWGAKVADASLGRFLDYATPQDPSTSPTNPSKDKEKDAAQAPLGSGASRTFDGWRWRAPEITEAEPGKSYSLASDMYSFALILWELLSPPALPYAEFSTDPRFVHAGKFELTIMQAICEGLRPSLPRNLPQLVTDLLVNCWDGRPLARPPFVAVVAALGNMLREESGTVSSSPSPDGMRSPLPSSTSQPQ